MSQQKTQPRIWTVTLGDDFDAFREEAQRAMLECEAIGARLGGKFYAEPKREQGEDGLWYTTSWVIAWDSFVPGKRTPAKAQADPDPKLEAEAAARALGVEPEHVEPDNVVRMRNAEGTEVIAAEHEVESYLTAGYYELPDEAVAA